MDLLPLSKEIILPNMYDCILANLESNGIRPCDVAELAGKERQCLERFFHPKQQYNPGYYYLYEVCFATGMDIPGIGEVDPRQRPTI